MLLERPARQFTFRGESRCATNDRQHASHAQYCDMIMGGEKIYEYRKRYPTTGASAWYVYLTAPASTLTAVIDLAAPIPGSPTEIAQIAEGVRSGNGASVYDYLAPAGQGLALPILRVREYPGLTVAELAAAIGKWHPPQGPTLIDRYPRLAKLCDQLIAAPIVRERQVRAEPP
jgi:predicted transcriptional regulator